MNRHTLLRAGFSTGIALLLADAALAYPIPPAPLWRLVAESDAIVVAEVLAVDEPTEEQRTKRDEDGSYLSLPSFARLRVVERWKGTTPSNVSVPFEPNMICPAPPRYEVGKTVLAFLEYDRDERQWFTSNLSYGTIYAKPDDLKLFAARVAEALKLQADKRMTKGDRTEWLIRCAEKGATRWHGLYELIGSPRPYAYDEENDRFTGFLSLPQKQRIADGFLQDPRGVDLIDSMLEVLESYHDPRLDRAIIDAIDAELANAEPNAYGTRDAIVALLKGAGEKDADNIVPEITFQDRKNGLANLKTAWTEAKERLPK